MEETSSQNNMDIDSEQDSSQEDYSSLLERILSVHVIKSKIFGFLSPKDIKNTVLVSRYMQTNRECHNNYLFQEMERACGGLVFVEVGHCQNAHSRPS